MQNRQAFEEIYKQYHLMVYNLSLHYLQNVEDAEEITQDVFVKLHHSLDKFEQKSALKTWIYRITINACLDSLKRRKSKKHFFVFGQRSGDENQAERIATFEHPGILLENKEKAELLFAQINTLPENQKTAFILSKLDGLSNPEIAAVMDTSVSAVESLVFRAKSALREKLAQKFEQQHKKK
ncbi:RNA polymerase sigma factor [Flavobacterium sp.]|uniref:RNA polymerase sigma factor n=1 Tax=Flavobacterium sp. TaxID=239 RepID=UPI0039E5A48D